MYISIALRYNHHQLFHLKLAFSSLSAYKGHTRPTSPTPKHPSHTFPQNKNLFRALFSISLVISVCPTNARSPCSIILSHLIFLDSYNTQPSSQKTFHLPISSFLALCHSFDYSIFACIESIKYILKYGRGTPMRSAIVAVIFAYHHLSRSWASLIVVSKRLLVVLILSTLGSSA